jgi:hypothetical protein
MPEPIRLKIPPDDAYGIIEALNYYLESWKATEVFLRDGVIYDGPIHDDCTSYETAHRQVLQFRGVLKRLHQGLDCIGKSQRPSNERKHYLQGKADGQDNLIQRVLANWSELHKIDSSVLHQRLVELKDEIYDV